ncbi:MAG: DUF4861 domain-containing protein, partial [Tannerellaceae bacterium]|nr:DUF4861 domain-containing protein [Tannerellaceae bacterium]
MNRFAFSAIFAITVFSSCTNDKALLTITVSNPYTFERAGEIVEIVPEALNGLPADSFFVVVNGEGEQVPYQITHEGKIIFQANVPAKAKAVYTLRKVKPEAFDTIVCGKQYPQRMDDIAWENDRIAFRTYGPALQASGERAFGYDVWVKNVPYLVVEDRYYRELTDGVSYHADNGNGLDYYNVGP